MLDFSFRGGGIRALETLRTSIDNCYIAHFKTTGILVQGGHETYIHNSFLGQHITAGGDPGEAMNEGPGSVGPMLCSIKITENVRKFDDLIGLKIDTI
nr:polygalacturonase QRT3 [Tanacetum cinerariifolium]